MIRAFAWRYKFAVLALVLLLALPAALVGLSATLLSQAFAARVPGTDTNQLKIVWTEPQSGQDFEPGLSGSDFQALTQHAEIGRRLAAFWSVTSRAIVDTGHHRKVIEYTTVSTNFLDVLGARVSAGRGFVKADGMLGSERVALVREPLWEEINRTGTDTSPSVTLHFERSRETYKVIGAIPAAYEFPHVADVWLPLERGWSEAMSAGQLSSTDEARLRVNRGLFRDLRAEATDLFQRAVPGLPSTPIINAAPDAVVVRATSLSEFSVGPIGISIALVAIICILTLLVASTSLAQFVTLLVHDPRAGIGQRALLGASPFTLFRQVMATPFAVALMAALLGLATTRIWPQAFSAYTEILPPFAKAALTDSTLVRRTSWIVAALVAIMTVPATLVGATSVRAIARRLLDKGHAVGRSPRLRVLAMTTLASSAAFAAATIVQGHLNAKLLDGTVFRDDVLTARVTPTSSVSVGETKIFFERLVERLRAVAGVQDSSSLFLRPLIYGDLGLDTPVFLGLPASGVQQTALVNWQAVGSRYFSTLGARVIAGREFTDADTADARPVAIVGAAAARRLWPNDSALEKQLFVRGGTDPRRTRTVVGVVDDIPYRGRVTFDVYPPHLQSSRMSQFVVLRIPAQIQESVASSAVRLAEEIDPRFVVDSFQTMATIRRAAVAPWVSASTLSLIIAVICLVSTLVALYLSAAALVDSQRRVWAIRQALGEQMRAQKKQLVTAIGWPALLGVSIGFAIVASSRRLFASVLFNLAPLDTGYAVVIGLALLVSAAMAVAPVLGRNSTPTLSQLLRE